MAPQLAISGGSEGIITKLLLFSAPIEEAGRNDKYSLNIVTAIPRWRLVLRRVSKLLIEGALINARPQW